MQQNRKLQKEKLLETVGDDGGEGSKKSKQCDKTQIIQISTKFAVCALSD